MEFENPLVVTLDGKVIYETVIGGEEDMKLYDQVQNGALDKPNERLKNIRFTATAGPHRVGVTFRRRTFAESDDQLQMFAPGGGQDRMYRINSFQIRGPFNAEGRQRDAEPRAHLQLPARATARRPTPRRAARDRSSSSLARRAYRRPVTDEDVNELMRYYERRRQAAAASRAACAARSPACWPARSSCIAASACPPACAPATPSRSPTSSWRRSCRSSSGTRFPTTSC